VLSVPLFVYRSLMLLWALWLAWSLLKWLRWAWQCFSMGGLWHPINWRRKKGASKTAAQEASGEPDENRLVEDPPQPLEPTTGG
jgi:hypothetical protein